MADVSLALVEPYVAVRSMRAYAERSEPAHLVGIYNIARDAGYSTTLIDAYSEGMAPQRLAGLIASGGYSHVGFTLYDYSPCIGYMEELFRLLPEDIITIVGGPGPTYCTEHILELFSPHWLVKGEGESVIEAILAGGLSPGALEAQGIRVVRHGATLVVDAPSVPFNSIPFRRPYGLEPYGYQAAPRVQRGCVGRCVFCSGAYQKSFDYLSPNVMEGLMQHLVNEKGAKVIAPLGPDFTTVPQRANGLIEVILRGGYGFELFRPGVRLDTLSIAIREAPQLWRSLASRYRVEFESSIESFSVDRLRRLGKNVPDDFFDSLFRLLDSIFNQCDATMVLGRIAIDPTMTIDEFIEDCRGFRALLKRFGDRVTIGGMLMNRFIPLEGTPATEPTEGANLWLLDEPKDPLMLRLKSELLEHERFIQWCSLAERLGEFGERNFVFEEILRVAQQHAEEIKGRCVL